MKKIRKIDKIRRIMINRDIIEEANINMCKGLVIQFLDNKIIIRNIESEEDIKLFAIRRTDVMGRIVLPKDLFSESIFEVGMEYTQEAIDNKVIITVDV